MTRTNRRYGLYDTVFSVNPWAVMRGAIADRVESSLQDESFAFLEQAEDFYRAGSAGLSANPLLTYYSFLNLAKVLIRVRGYRDSLNRARHGLAERTEEHGSELENSVLIAKDDPGPINIFPELIERLGFQRPTPEEEHRVIDLLPEIVVGHRIWRESGRGQNERFVAIERIEFLDDRAAKETWLRLYINRGDLSRYGISPRKLLAETGVADEFRQVSPAPDDRDGSLCLEQTQASGYTGRPTDVVSDLVNQLKPKLWRIVSAVPDSGYRRYYLHLRPTDSTAKMTQLASMWALTFYFGSVVRYRPHLFDQILRSRHGAFVAEFISSQPEQMLYLLASEVCGREMARPAIV